MGAQTIDTPTFNRISRGFDAIASRSHSLHADCYRDPGFRDLERQQIFHKSWQFLCHEEKLAQPGSYVATQIEGQSIFACRDKDGELRAFYNVCKHRGHELLQGSGKINAIACPYHAWVYGLDGRLSSARRSELIENFDTKKIRLDGVRVETFCHLVFVNLDPEAPALTEQSESLSDEIMSYAPDLANLTYAHTLTYRIKANWKAVVDNFLECYHCPVAHRDFCTLVEMDTYKVKNPRHLLESYGQSGPRGQPSLWCRQCQRYRPRRLVPVAEYYADALSGTRQLHGLALLS